MVKKRPARRPAPQPAANLEFEINGELIQLVRSDTELIVQAPGPIPSCRNRVPGAPQTAAALKLAPGVTLLRELGSGLHLFQAPDIAARDLALAAARQTNIAHFAFTRKDTQEAIYLNGRIYLKLKNDSPAALDDLLNRHALRYLRRVADSHLVEITRASVPDAVEAATKLQSEAAVANAHPEVLHQLFAQNWQADIQALPLYPRQWPLDASLFPHPELRPGTDIRVQGAWNITTGQAATVVAVLDDGFDLTHPALRGARLHDRPRRFCPDEGSRDVLPDGNNFHGTPVASLIFGSPYWGAMHGVAPHCTFLPLRMPYGLQAPSDVLCAMEYASTHADVLNCSFSPQPGTLPLPVAVSSAIHELSVSGGRRKTGLVIIFAAGNDDAPTGLGSGQNKNGVVFRQRGTRDLGLLPPGTHVHGGYTAAPGIITVAAITSLGRKAGYSNWGPHITLCAPSDNWHNVPLGHPTKTVPADIQSKFNALYRGLGVVAALNISGGSPFVAVTPPPVLPVGVPGYTASFGGTSAAAAMVAGVAALVISANPELPAEKVRENLKSTASKDVDLTPDLPVDPNLQGETGCFTNGHSLLFGAGCVDAAAAVQEAHRQALACANCPPHSPPPRVSPPQTQPSSPAGSSTSPATPPPALRPPPIRKPKHLTGPAVYALLLDCIVQRLPQTQSVQPLTALVGPVPALFPTPGELYRWTYYELSVFFGCDPRIAYGENFHGTTVAELASALFHCRRRSLKKLALRQKEQLQS